MVLLPGAAYLDAGLAVAAQTTGRSAPALDNVRFTAPLLVENNDVPTMRLTTEPGSGRFSVTSSASSATSWPRHASGRIVDGLVAPTLTLPELTGSVSFTADELYPRLAERGLSYGPAFRRIVDAQLDDGRVLARVDATDTSVTGSNHQAHPTVLDAALQCVALLADADDASAGGAVVPVAVRHVRQFAALPDEVLVGVTRRATEPGEARLVADVVLADVHGQVLVELHRVQFQPISPRPPVLNELDRLWIEPVFEPREPRDPAGRDEAVASERVFLVAAGEESTRWAGDYAAQRGAGQPLVVRGGDPPGAELITTSAPCPPVSWRTSSMADSGREFTTCSAPKVRRTSARSGVDAVAMTRAPGLAAICTAAIPTPPAPLATSTHSPGWTWAACLSA